MPRTKQTKAKRNSGSQEQVRDFNRLVQLRIHKLDLDFKGIVQQFDSSITVLCNRFPVEIQNITLRELLTEDKSQKKENLSPKTPKVSKESKKSMRPPRSAKPKRTTAISDDGYQSESAASQASKMNLRATRRSRSVTTNKKPRESSRSASRDRKSNLNSTTSQKAKKEVTTTPQCKTTNTFVITPKIKMNSAINVLRKPKEGEMVFSTQGSPLLVSTTVNDRTANINVPLRNGNIVSLLPFNENSLSDNLHLDEETKQQLQILQSHLAKVLK